MKEDILEQLVDDYLQTRGYFTRHNLKFRPREDHADFVRNQDSNHSDIDVLGYHPRLSGPERVMAVSCKSWQSGFRVHSIIGALEGNKVRSGREAWKAFRELIQPIARFIRMRLLPNASSYAHYWRTRRQAASIRSHPNDHRCKWSEAFIAAAQSATGSSEFTYVTAVTAIRGDRTTWENYPSFGAAMQGNPIRLLSLGEMLNEVVPAVSTTMASSQLGRMIQLLKASGCSLTTADIADAIDSAET